MSVVLMVTLKPGATPPSGPDRWDFVPVAPQRTFIEHWVPLAQSLGLDYIPLFETGMILRREDLPHVIRELEVLAAHAPEELPGLAADGLCERVQLVLSVLRALDPETVEDFFIG